jgi:uncharacterized protein involved in outer membrane biogenesis
MNQQSPKGARRRWPWFLATAAALVLSCISILLTLVSQYDFNSLKPFITRIVKEKTGRDLLIQGPIEFNIGLMPSLTVEKVVLQNAPGGTLPEMARAERIEVELALFPLLRKRIQVKKFILMEPKFVLETDRSGRSNLCFRSKGELPATGETKAPDLSVGEIDVERGIFVYKDGKTGKGVSIAVHRLKAKSTRNGDRIELEMRGAYASKPFDLSGWVGSMASLMTPEVPWRIDVRARAFETEIFLNGSIRSFNSSEGLALKVRGAGRTFKGIEEAFRVGHIPEVAPFKIQFDLSGKKDRTYRLSNLKFSSKAGDGRGDLNLNLSGSRPDLRGWLSWAKLDVATLLSKGAAPERVITGKDEKKRIFPSEPLPFECLEKMTGDVELTADRVILPHTVLEELKTRLHATERCFVAKPLFFKGGGGQAEGALKIGKERRAVTVVAQARMNRVDLNLLLKQRRAQGMAEAEIDVTAQGASIADLMGSLDGRALVAVRGFRVENKYVKLLGSDFITNLSQIFTPASREASVTEINCLVSGFRITNGFAQVTAMVADTNEMVAIGRGQLDLKEERLDLTISPQPKKGFAGLTLSFSELTRAFRLGGTFAEPSLDIDPLHTALTIGKAVGGVFLIGPAGAALAFAGQSAGEEDVCMAAMEAARESGKAPEEKTEEKQGGDANQGRSGTSAGIHSIGESVGRLFKKLSSQPATPVDIYGGGP